MTTHIDEYKPVPVSVAANIAREFDKSIVIIAAWDPVHGLLHTTTYGRNTLEKHWAAEGGDIVHAALGGDQQQKTTYEDFRGEAGDRGGKLR